QRMRQVGSKFPVVRRCDVVHEQYFTARSVTTIDQYQARLHSASQLMLERLRVCQPMLRHVFVPAQGDPQGSSRTSPCSKTLAVDGNCIFTGPLILAPLMGYRNRSPKAGPAA